MIDTKDLKVWDEWIASKERATLYKVLKSQKDFSTNGVKCQKKKSKLPTKNTKTTKATTTATTTNLIDLINP